MDAAISPSGITRHKAQAPITTRRLLLRLHGPDDIPALTRLLNDPVIAGFTAYIPHPYTALHARRFVTSCAMGDGPHLAAHFVMAMKANPRLIVGGAGIACKEGGMAEIGYWIAAPHRRRGFASEAVRAMLRRIFEESSAERVQAWVHARNAASQRVLKRAGFRRIGAGLRHSRSQQRYVPAIDFALDRAQWRKGRAPRPAQANS